MTTIPHVKCTAAGVLGLNGGSEIWSCGLKLILTLAGQVNTPVAASATDLAEIGDRAKFAWAAFIQRGVQDLTDSTHGFISGNVKLDYVKTAAVIASGKDDPALSSYVSDVAGIVRGRVDPLATDSQAGRLPYTVALAVSLKGDGWQRGAAAHGRFYIPGPNLYPNLNNGQATLLTDGLMVQGAAELHAQSAALLLSEINAVTLTSGKEARVSNVSTSDAASGLRWQNVTRVSVDTRPDTIRRRGSKLGGRGVVDKAVTL